MSFRTTSLLGSGLSTRSLRSSINIEPRFSSSLIGYEIPSPQSDLSHLIVCVLGFVWPCPTCLA
jgi:hypothetical protein